MIEKALEDIQLLQFSDLDAANRLLLEFFRSYLPFNISDLQIRPLAVSLNSINGFFISEDGRKLFFKTHVEPQSVINEFYNSTILSEAGYNVLRPIYSVTEQGKQVLIYEFINIPSLFDVLHDIEDGRRKDGNQIVAIQRNADIELVSNYLTTLQYSSVSEHFQAPIHQLFYHRLSGGRLESFYKGKDIILPGRVINFEQLKRLSWDINGNRYEDTLDDLIRKATYELNPARSGTPSIIGHGDAHNGNVFYDERHSRLQYFDPAFAGRHSPLLDLAKPLFHNVFANWLYFPKQVSKELSIDCEFQNNTIVVRHNFTPSPIRAAIFRSKISLVLKPLLQDLNLRRWLSPDWRTYLKLALFCCPFLTMNLSDQKRFPPDISLLGLSMSVEMGSGCAANTAGLLDSEIDKIASEMQLL